MDGHDVISCLIQSEDKHQLSYVAMATAGRVVEPNRRPDFTG